MNTRRILRIVGAMVALSLVVVGVAYAFGVGNVDGVWEYVEDSGADEGAYCDGWATVAGGTVTAFSSSDPAIQTGSNTDENQVRYGRPEGLSNCPSGSYGFGRQSGFGFDGINGPISVGMDAPFYLGSFTHYNNPVYQSSPANPLAWVDLAVTVPVDCDDNGTADTTFLFYPRFGLDETPNNDDTPTNPCPYLPGDPVNDNGCADKVTIVQPPNPTFTCSGVQYTVNILGFTTNADCATVYDASAAKTEFVTKEQATNNACLWANIAAPTADARVLKDCNGFATQDPHYVVTVDNLGPGVALGAQIVDVLPNGVTYASYTSQRTVGGVTSNQGTCTVSGQTVTCNLNAVLPATTTDDTAKWVVDINVDYAQVTNPSFENQATLTTTSVDPVTANNTSPWVTCTPTEVELGPFTATGAVRSVVLHWETYSETDNLGFNIYRAPSLKGKKTKVNKEIIPGLLGSPTGRTYEYTDEPLAPNKTFFYWLEDLDSNGQTVLHGPVQATTLKNPKKK
ncbi:MAG: DUF11 domain-containing protein [Chloroflexi bacterium]|mgnify:CR=1 FL=1|nr:DUF11 domain-containing protein [Chloroflexota bacterium]